MSLLFRDAELFELMEDFYVLTGIRTVLFDEDFRELAAYPMGEHSFCHCMRKNESFLERCHKSDRQAFEKCRKKGEIHIFTCHAGLCEACAPIKSNGKVMGYLMLGRITDIKNKDELVSRVLERCGEYDVPQDHEDKIRKIKYRSEKQIRAAAKILDACCEYVKLRELVHPSGKQMIDLLERYVDMHIREDISVERICRELDISRTKLYETLRPHLNGGIAAYVKHRRLEYAKELVKSSEMTIPEISDACGFADYNYFLRSFKQKYGMSTKQFRENAP